MNSEIKNINNKNITPESDIPSLAPIILSQNIEDYLLVHEMPVIGEINGDAVEAETEDSPNSLVLDPEKLGMHKVNDTTSYLLNAYMRDVVAHRIELSSASPLSSSKRINNAKTPGTGASSREDSSYVVGALRSFFNQAQYLK